MTNSRGIPRARAVCWQERPGGKMAASPQAGNRYTQLPLKMLWVRNILVLENWKVLRC